MQEEDYGKLVSKLIWEVSQRPVLYDPQNPMYKDSQERMKAWQSVGEKLNMPVPNCQIKWGTLRRCLANARKRQKRRQLVGSKYIKKWRHQDEMSFLLPYIDQRETDCTFICTKPSKSSHEGDSLSRHELYISEEYEHSDTDDIETKQSSDNLQPYLVENVNTDHSAFQIQKFQPGSKSEQLEELYEEEDEVILEQPENKSWTIKGVSGASTSTADTSYLSALDEMDTFFLSMSKTIKKLPKMEQIRVRCQVYNTVTQAEINWLKKKGLPETSSVPDVETEILHI